MRPTLLQTNQRAAIRRAACVDCEVVRERDASLVAQVAIDLSTRGMLVETDAQLLTGEEVLVTFKSPRRNAWYRCEATVARVVHARRRYDGRRLLGLCFLSLGEAQLEELRRDLRGLPPPMPRRHARIDYAARVRSFLLN
jgi:hypothetical protein